MLGRFHTVPNHKLLRPKDGVSWLSYERHFMATLIAARFGNAIVTADSARSGSLLC